MDEEKEIELEIKLAHQEKALKDLSQVMYEQQKKIDALEKAFKRLKDRMKAEAERAEAPDVIDEKPPHY